VVDVHSVGQRAGERFLAAQDGADRRAALSYVGGRDQDRGRRMVAMFACMYYAALRPAEAVNPHQADCELPETGWGRLHLTRTTPEVGKRYTASGELHDDNGLKHRPDDEIRPVPIPPELVQILRWHISEFGAALDGRLFRQPNGNVVGSSTYTGMAGRAGHRARSRAGCVPLAGRPYDLRHAAVSLWLNAGVPAPTITRRAGHSVDVLRASTLTASTATRR
jgi:integrase